MCIRDSEKPDYGSIFIHGLDMQKRKRETKKLVGFVPHETDLDPWLTLEQNINRSKQQKTRNLYIKIQYISTITII